MGKSTKGTINMDTDMVNQMNSRFHRVNRFQMVNRLRKQRRDTTNG